MNLTTITMSRTEARKKFLEYRAAVRDRHDKEDEQIMRGYKALAKGSQIIDIAATIRAGGYEMQTKRNKTCVLPKLAVMRADQKWCNLYTSNDGSVKFHSERYANATRTRNLIELPAGTVRPMPWEETSHWDYQALVPPVPPSLRPSDKLSNYHILWEAEWKRCAPVDPALLKHIGGDLYAVVAIWDLTELERTVLMGRFA